MNEFIFDKIFMASDLYKPRKYKNIIIHGYEYKVLRIHSEIIFRNYIFLQKYNFRQK